MQYTPLVKRHIRQARLYASHSPVISPKVGCVITMESDVLTYGWNEDLRQLPNYKASGSSGRAIHAEESAILKAVNNPHISLVGTTLFSTRAPCWVCAKMIMQVGISTVVWGSSHSDDGEGINLLRAAGVKEVQIRNLVNNN